jgi:hypothetical protein
MFSPDEVPEGMTDEEYMAQLQEQYGDKLCVYIEYALGYIYISAPPNQGEGFRYYPCGLTGLGAGEIEQKTEEVTIAGQAYVAQGFEWIGDMAPCSPPRETLDCHSETMIIELEDGTRIEYGARYEPTATYKDYLMKGRDMLLEILASYETVPDAQGDPYPGWASYVNTDYGFAFRYVTTWSLEERPEEEMSAGLSAKSVVLRQGTLRLVIQYKRPAEELILGPGGVPAGDTVDRGTVTFLGRELPKHVLVFEGKDKSVFYGDRFEELEFYIQLDDDPGVGVDYRTLEIPENVQAEVDQILESFELVLTRE